jgi:hypothetical protein
MLFLLLAFALWVALGWGGAWLLLIGNLIPRRVVAFWAVFVILKLVFLLWYSIGTFGGSSLAWSDSWLVCSLVSLLVLSQVPCLPMHFALHLYHISWCIDFGSFDICVSHSVIYHVSFVVHSYLCCICTILHFRMMSFFHMPHLSFFSYLWDIGLVCGEMAMWGYALEIFEIYVLWDSLFESNANLD